MKLARNGLKAALAEGRLQRGLWLALGSPAVAELAGQAGFDWCLVDGEHAPYDITAIRDQLLALAGTPAAAVVRVPAAEPWLIKQVLDIGAQTLLVPMVDSAEAARAVVAACRYPPAGIRGVGAALGRASGYNAIADYTTGADREICVIVQAETRASLADLDAIAATEGVDAVFIGPADLSADMGHPGDPGAPEVTAAIEDAIGRIRAAGKAVGIIDLRPGMAEHYRDLGVGFVGVGADVTALGAALRGLAAGQG
ncbi:4-hydroxy-2-oxoheptanedioate aldolase [Rhodovulum iodosum]|uniref:4-hydroxy-2-oxoheptanedioate aldolase n=1 Tax=Rhodovulum iodosum TaxID=68291 RepID=A0ABV3XUP6_9RHOB|nr:aldolase/citrate lyase family protein [Rhodovulum robiginosum]RSK35108.1 2-keto-3-deoxy-L-rhamnonate aldolase [Rhodovulum robiginosum]